MLGMIASLVFVAAGCGSVSAMALTVREQVPALRRLQAEKRALTADREFLVSLIEGARHPGWTAGIAPAAAPLRLRRSALAVRRLAARTIRRRVALVSGQQSPIQQPPIHQTAAA